MHAYTARDEVREDGTQKSQRVFVNLPTEVGATEAEEIGEWPGRLAGAVWAGNGQSGAAWERGCMPCCWRALASCGASVGAGHARLAPGRLTHT